ncbi:iron chelate uptake ABC transporter family permease subunit [Pikeienuella sp. HZG-20]|uniref:iron chelate uptake ABC transporter family permease subunit n=1 Tax=Paludibacillus litoralis TaxID=3133267 RepID=UPI0030EF42FC
MLDDFMVRAGLAGLGVALAAGPLGCFVVWRRMAYFGDATAHAAILGVALSLAFSFSITFGVLLAAFAMAMAISSLSGRGLAVDTLLGVAAHAALAIGLVAMALTSDRTIDIDAYLFGEILAVGRLDLALIWAGAALVLGLLYWRWSALLTATINEELACASGVDPRRERLILTLALALVVAAALKVVGALLITAMLIIPAAAARRYARGPEAMAATAALIGAVAVAGGLRASWVLDTPTGPTIVVAATVLFLGSTLFPFGRR